MGLFNFLKSKKQREKEELILKMQNQVFPDGDKQMNKVIKDVQELLNMQYSFVEVKNTYIQAASMYLNSSDQGQSNIVTGILKQEKSVVRGEDAVKIYNYIIAKYQLPKASKERVYKKVVRAAETPDDSKKLYLVAQKGTDELHKIMSLTDEGKFEGILFNTLSVLNHYQTKFPNKYKEVEDKYFLLLYKQGLSLKLGLDFNEFTSFINKRFQFYSDEITKLQDGDRYLPARIYNAFYENPLCDEPEVSLDFFQVMIFYSAMNEMIYWVNNRLLSV